MKQGAAIEAAAHVQPEHRLGLGTGSTVELFLNELARRWKAGELGGLRCVPSSLRTAAFAGALNLPLVSLEEADPLDLTVDGADEIDPEGGLLKGRGGALLREKVLAQASVRYIVIVDATKRVESLGSLGPVPVEVLPFATAPVSRRMTGLGAEVQVRMVKGQAFMTDQDNVILDCDFGPLADPRGLAGRLAEVAGVLEHGLFLGFRATILTGTPDGVERQEVV